MSSFGRVGLGWSAALCCLLGAAAHGEPATADSQAYLRDHVVGFHVGSQIVTRYSGAGCASAFTYFNGADTRTVQVDWTRVASVTHDDGAIWFTITGGVTDDGEALDATLINTGPPDAIARLFEVAQQLARQCHGG